MSGSHPFRAAVEARDLDAMAATLAEDVVFNSPILFRPFEGRETTIEVLRNVLEVFDDFHYTDELPGDGIHALIFRARVGDREVEGLDLLRTGDDGLIHGFTVMVRPFTAAVALRDAMGERLGEATA